METLRNPDFSGAIAQHRELCEMLRHGSAEDVEGVLANHIIGARSLLNHPEAEPRR